MKSRFARFSEWTLSVLVLAAVAACSSSPRQPAPVEDRTSARNAPAETKALPGAENAGKPGYYTVQKGDTLTRIGLDNGQAWRDLARWNNLGNPDMIEVGQVLRVAPPGAVVENSGVVVRPVTSSAAQPANGANNAAANTAKPQASAPSAPAQTPAMEDFSFAWPANGQVIAGFDEAKNKGLDIAGKAGDPVMAAADGQVVYAGAGLRGMATSSSSSTTTPTSRLTPTTRNCWLRKTRKCAVAKRSPRWATAMPTA